MVARSLLTLLALGAASLGLRPVIASGPWHTTVLVTLALLWALLTVLRTALTPLARAHPLLALGGPSLGGLVAASAIVLVRFGGGGVPDTEGGLGGVIDALEGRAQQVADLLSGLPDAVTRGVPPIDATATVEASVTVGTLLVAIVVELLVAGLAMSWGATLGVVLTWLTPWVLLRDVPTAPFIVAVAACLLAALIPPTRSPAPMWRWRLTGGALAGALVMVMALGTATGLTAGTTPTALSWLHRASSVLGPFDVNRDIAVGTDLGKQTTAVAYSYVDQETTTTPSRTASDSEKSRVSDEPMRLYSLVDFDGTHWSPRDSGDGSPHPTIRLADSRNTAQPRPPTVMRSVSISDLKSSHLPMSLDPATYLPGHATRDQALAGGEPVTFDTTYDELVPDGETPRTYTLLVSPRHLSPSVLRHHSLPSGQSPDPRYLQVPNSPHANDIAELARSITRGASTEYQKLVALQHYFRDTGDFTYSTTVAPTQDDDPVWTFLSTKSGYCVQFASAMAVMARSLGIPTRMAVGFLPGDRDNAGTVQVTGQQAHTWPEFLFDQQAWVRFEPTPAVQTGPAPAWSDTTAKQDAPAKKDHDHPQPDPSSSATNHPTPTPDHQDAASPTAPAAGTPSSAEPRSAVLSWGAGLLLVLIAASAAIWFTRRRRRAIPTVTAAWRRVLRQARRAGLHRTENMTVRALGDAMHALLPASSTRAHVSLTSLVNAVEENAYSPGAVDVSPVILAQWVTRITAGLTSRPRPHGPAESSEQ